jgi:hypothetical protein
MRVIKCCGVAPGVPDEVGDTPGVIVEAGITGVLVGVGVEVVVGGDWLQEEKVRRQNSRKEQRKVARFVVIEKLPLYKCIK